MKLADIAAARREAEAFISAVCDVLVVASRQQKEARERMNMPDYHQTCIDACKQSGALQRTSMDLTRALAVMRGRTK